MSETAPSEGPYYVAGGTLPPGMPSYIERRADDELYERLLAGEFCYVLTPRQMGKSSLMARTAKRLEAEEVCAAIVDLTQVGTERSAAAAVQWYYGVAHEIHRKLRIAEPLRPWWQERENLPALQRLTEFFRDLVLKHCPGRVVVFVDEIDSTIGLPFADDFFAALRACFNARATDPTFERLTFALFGVATPDQLIRDLARTPFNIGRRIDLTDFTPEEAGKLAGGLHADPEEASQRLKRVLHWTGGHPYLTQALCRAVEEASEDRKAGSTDEVVDPLVTDLFLSSRAQREETNLKHARARLTPGGPFGRRLLRLYLRVRRGETVPDEPTSALFAQLKLAGVAKVTDEGRLAVRNRIYETVFNPDWVKSEMPVDWSRWSAYTTAAASLALALIWYAVFQPRPYIEQINLAEEDYAVAAEAYSKLYANPFSRFRANELMAQFWERRALKAAVDGDRDRSLLSWMQAIKAKDSERRRKEAQQLVGEDYAGLVATFRHKESVRAVTFSPDARTVLTGSGGTARLWDVRSGKAIAPALPHSRSVNAVAFSPDGRTALTGTLGTVRLWDVRSGKPLSTPLRQGGVESVTFSPAGPRAVLNVSWGGDVQLWDVRSGESLSPPLQYQHEVVSATLRAPNKTPRNVGEGFNPSWPGGEKPHPYEKNLIGALSPDGQLVLIDPGLTWGLGGARLWDLRTGRPLFPPLRHGGPVSTVAFSPDGRTFLTGSEDGTTRLWDSRSGHPLSAPLWHWDVIQSVAFSPDGRTILTGSRGGTARLWDSRSRRPLSVPLWHQDVIQSVAFSPDGRTVLTGSRDQTARLWDAQIGNPPSSHSLLHQRSLLTVALRPDGRAVLTGSEDGIARLWDASSGKLISQFFTQLRSMYGMAFSPDGQYILIGSMSYSVPTRLYDPRTGKPGKPLSPSLGRYILVYAVAFSPDGGTILTGSDDGTARLWDSQSGKPRSLSLRHRFPVFAVAFSPDGRTVLTGSGDRVARLWDSRNGKQISSTLQHGVSMSDVAFNRDGNSFIVVTENWLIYYAFDGRTAQVQSARLLRGIWMRGFRFPPDCPSCVQVALGDTGDSIRIETINLDEPDNPPIQGDPERLLKDWQRRLGLKFDEKMNIVPRVDLPDADPDGHTDEDEPSSWN